MSSELKNGVNDCLNVAEERSDFAHDCLRMLFNDDYFWSWSSTACNCLHDFTVKSLPNCAICKIFERLIVFMKIKIQHVLTIFIENKFHLTITNNKCQNILLFIRFSVVKILENSMKQTLKGTTLKRTQNYQKKRWPSIISH